MNLKIIGAVLATVLSGAAATTAVVGPSYTVFAYSPSGVQELILNTDSGDQTIRASGTGWYNDAGFHEQWNPNYITGVCGSSDGCNGDDANYHSYFAFDLANISGTILGATLSIGNASNGYISDQASILLNIYEVLTSFDEVNADQFGRTDIYDDLSDGTLFANYLASSADNNTQVLITLNAAALAALNDALGGFIIFGGSVDPKGGVITDVPVPASLAFLGLGLAAVVATRRRKA